MKELSKLGLVEQRLSDEKSTFSATSPRSMLSSLISIKAEELKKLRERIATCIPALESMRNDRNNEFETDKEAHFRVTLGEKKSNEIMTRMWRQARQEILIMLPKETACHFFVNSDSQKLLEAMARKHVKVRIIVELDQSSAKVISSLCKKCEVRCCEQVFTHMTIVDNSQILLGGGNPATKGKGKGASMASLWTDNVSFVYSMRRFMEGFWNTSFSVEQKIASMESGQSLQHTEVVRSRFEIDKLFTTVVGRARNRLLISLGSDSVGAVKNNLKDLKGYHKMGLRAKVMMKIDDNSQTSVVVDLLKIADVKHCQQIPFTALITDSEMILYTDIGAEPEVMWVTARDMVEKFYSVAKEIFREGKSASTRLWEVKTGAQIGEGLFRQLYTSKDNDKETGIEQPEFETVLTQGEGNQVYRKMPGITYFRSYDSRTSKLQAGYAVLEPSADSGFYFHPGEEVTIVVEGSVTIEVDKNVYELKHGDTLHYPSSLPHRMRNPATNKETAKIFTVDYPPTF